MVIACPDCTARLDVAEDSAEKPTQKVLCPGCKKVFLMKDGIRAALKLASASLSSSGSVKIPPPAPPPLTAVPPVSQPPRIAKPTPLVARVPPVAPAEPPRPAPRPDPPAADAAGPESAAFDPSETRKMPAGELAALRAERAAARQPDAPGSLEEALAGALSTGAPVRADAWQVDRADYKDTAFDMDELKDLIKRGWLDRDDGIRIIGSTSWLAAIDHPMLATAFMLRQKLDAKNLAQAVAKGPVLSCATHPKQRAIWRCDTCHRAYCGSCSNESEIRQQMVMLCVECDVPLKPL